MKSVFYYDTVIGRLGIVADKRYIYEICFGEKELLIEEKELIKESYHQ